MYLKNITLQGFKSFADKVELQFGHGVSVVVGPNGSGKSNIVDAIRWVLGEQSVKSLRGAKMEDVIFSGSTNRKAVGMAEISLGLDNTNGYFASEYSEIIITRRLYRSGESEFLINKRPCRLKDVHELFMDTGLGKEAFSVIGQGKVEEILNSKPEDRRFIVEDVAGIIKYKNRKKEAMRRLEETQQNLQRIHDLIIELGDRLSPLEQEAKLATYYKELKEQLDQLEIAVLVRDLKAADSLITELQTTGQRLKEEKILSETQQSENNAKLEGIKLSLSQQSELLSQKQQALYSLTNEMEKKNRNIVHNRQMIQEYTGQQETIATEKNQLEQKVLDIKRELVDLQESWTELTEKELAAKSQQAQLNADVVQQKQDLNRLIGDRDELKNLIFDLASKAAQQKNMASYTETERKRILAAIEKKREELANSSKGLDLLKEKRLNQEKQNQDWKLKNQKLNDEKRLLQEKLQQLLGQKTELEKDYKELETSKEQIDARLKVLKEMQHSFEGYQYGVKAILKEAANSNRLPGIVGVLGDLINVSQQHSLAIETALGGAIQNIITTTQEAAKAGIQFLKDKQAGRCTFLPIQSIKGSNKFRLEEIKDWPKVLGLASELVGYDRKLEGIISYLLDRTVIVEDIDTAIKVANLYEQKVKVVTLEGDQISPGGALTGGSNKGKQTGLLTRSSTIKDLEQESAAIAGQISGKIDGINNFNNQLIQSQEMMSKLEQEIQKLSLLKVELDKDKNQWELELIRAENIHRTLVQEEELAQQELNSLQEEIANSGHAFKLHQANEEQAQIRLTGILKDIAGKELELESTQQSLTEIKVDAAALEQQISSSLRQINQIKRQFQELSTEILLKVQKQDGLSVRIEELEKAIQEEEEQLLVQVVNKKELEQEVHSGREQVTELEGQIKALQDLERQINRRVLELQEQIHGFEVKLARLESEQLANIERLKESFSLDLSDAEGLVGEKLDNLDKRDAIAKIRKLKLEISQLGVVNLGAIEEYARLHERHQFLSTQYNDLELAKQAVHKVINEIDEIMVQRFSEAYHQLTHHFSQIFQELFGGGNAALVLTDEDNLLETGIDIIAQPPGKKPQHLSLLSGGERAMTAIAILFATLRVKPSPFCVLDEIEASLDEANVHRFAAFLQGFAEKTQFVVISHRKGTMEIANILYGVTMEESGVSKLVSVKLTEAS